MIYIKPSLTNTTEAKLLYVMGATWHNQCMFDLAELEDNFSTLLNKQGIETYTFNIIGSGSMSQTDIIGDRHNDNIKLAKEIIEKYNIEYVMGYSNGCGIVASLVSDTNIRGALLLDPGSTVKVNLEFIENNDKVLITKDDIRTSLIESQSPLLQDTIDKYLRALCDGDSLITAAYSKLERKWPGWPSKPNLYNRLFLTKNTTAELRSRYPNHIYYPEASHWILLEEHRKQLALDVKQFIDFVETKR